MDGVSPQTVLNKTHRLVIFLKGRGDMAGHAVPNVEKRNVCMILVWKLERKRPLGRPRLYVKIMLK